MDEIAGNMDEEVIMQIGNTKYTPKNAKYFDFIESYHEIQELNRKARIVVCHDGAGSFITALQYSKPLIVVPKLKKYGECFYDNKVELAIELEKIKKIKKIIYDIDELENILKNIDTDSVTKINEHKGLILALTRYIANLEKPLDNLEVL
jgi:UDP-N-acetylglucosamine transferase subunit ALG13